MKSTVIKKSKNTRRVTCSFSHSRQELFKESSVVLVLCSFVNTNHVGSGNASSGFFCNCSLTTFSVAFPRKRKLNKSIILLDFGVHEGPLRKDCTHPITFKTGSSICFSKDEFTITLDQLFIYLTKDILSTRKNEHPNH